MQLDVKLVNDVLFS